MLSVLIPCSNERPNIAACVDSARLVADEIVVVDAGSTDGSLDLVASMHDCRMVPWSCDEGDIRHKAVGAARGNWLLWLEPAERITPALAAEIDVALNGGADLWDGGWIGRQTFFMGQRARRGPWLNGGGLRLVRRAACEGATARGIERGRRGRLSSPLLHYTVDSYDEDLGRCVRGRGAGLERPGRGRKSTTAVGLLVKPAANFLWHYIARGGFLDGTVGVQTCAIQAFQQGLVARGRRWHRGA